MVLATEELLASAIEQALCRIANAHIQLKQGEAAFKANGYLSAVTFIPAAQLMYQQA